MSGACGSSHDATPNPPASLPPLPSTVVELPPLPDWVGADYPECGGLTSSAFGALVIAEQSRLCAADVEAGRLPAYVVPSSILYYEECALAPLLDPTMSASSSDAVYTEALYHAHDCMLAKARAGLVWWTGVDVRIATPECLFGRHSREVKARALVTCYSYMMRSYSLQRGIDASRRVPPPA